jgi:hypothetical protein
VTDIASDARVNERIARVGTRLSVVGIGVSLLTYALAMAAPQLPPLLVAVVIVLALACMVPVIPMLRPRRQESEETTVDTAELQRRIPLLVLADGCDQLYRTLATFRDERRQARPRRGMLGRGYDTRMLAWQRITVERYERELRSWALGLFDDVEAMSLISSSARRSVANPSAAQIEHLPELFEAAARRLEQAAR